MKPMSKAIPIIGQKTITLPLTDSIARSRAGELDVMGCAIHAALMYHLYIEQANESPEAIDAIPCPAQHIMEHAKTAGHIGEEVLACVISAGLATLAHQGHQILSAPDEPASPSTLN